jgi:hypothetical protein
MPAGDKGLQMQNVHFWEPCGKRTSKAGSWAVIVKASFVTAVFFGLTAPSRAQETPHLKFVSEYVRELGKVEHLRSLAMDEMKDESNRMASCIRSSTRFQLELQSQISMLRGMRLNPPFETLPANIASFYEQKIDLYKRLAMDALR